MTDLQINTLWKMPIFPLRPHGRGVRSAYYNGHSFHLLPAPTTLRTVQGIVTCNNPLRMKNTISRHSTWRMMDIRRFGSFHLSKQFEKTPLRSIMRPFYMAVHPDLQPDSPKTANIVNAQSLAELNAYTDALQSSLTYLYQGSKSKQPNSDTLSGKDSTNNFEKSRHQFYFVEKSLLFFRPHVTLLGRLLPGRVQPIRVTLPCLRPTLTYQEAEDIAAYVVSQLLRKTVRGAVPGRPAADSKQPENASSAPLETDTAEKIDNLLRRANAEFSCNPPPSVLSRDALKSRSGLNELWRIRVADAITASALHPPSDRRVKALQELHARFCMYRRGLMRRFRWLPKFGGAGSRRRKLYPLKPLNEINSLAEQKTLANVPDTENITNEWSLNDDCLSAEQVSSRTLKPPKKQQGIDEKSCKSCSDDMGVAVQLHLDGIFHPFLVFLDRTLSIEQRQEARKTVLGKNLQNEAEMWLLHNLFRALMSKGHEHSIHTTGTTNRPRSMGLPVPLVIATVYDASSPLGFIKVPYNFNVWQLADFLEEHLERVRECRVQLLHSVGRSTNNMP
eukprot:GHVT01100213.1.p1 GENE.GHVT01100213.1~~GHVT01100213.1.p1  ORF type:complete len:561 (-),score=9.52 GHVT01100213.1:152-1834(-)